jgi:hypothetical protein
MHLRTKAREPSSSFVQLTAHSCQVERGSRQGVSALTTVRYQTRVYSRCALYVHSESARTVPCVGQPVLTMPPLLERVPRECRREGERLSQIATGKLVGSVVSRARVGAEEGAVVGPERLGAQEVHLGGRASRRAAQVVELLLQYQTDGGALVVAGSRVEGQSREERAILSVRYLHEDVECL